MGVGKTTTGKALAKELNMKFLDLDFIIVDRLKLSVTDIFKVHGEDYFRKLERDILHETFAEHNVIISTGGGTPCYFDNMKKMISNGVTFYLKAPAEVIAKRLESSYKTRPLFNNSGTIDPIKWITEKLKERDTYYEMARYKVDANHKNAVYYMQRILSGNMY